MAEPDVCAPIDANGNLTADGARTLEWDARNQPVAVELGTYRSEFSYDAQKRRVTTIEKVSGTAVASSVSVWCEWDLCEDREPSGSTITRRLFEQGEQKTGSARYFAVDHLGSAREVTNASSSLLARYEFDPWGRRAVTAGTDVASVGFTGHQYHSVSGAMLSLHRAYDPNLGRWLSEDPIGLAAGPNSYSYVENRPTDLVDLLGLIPKPRARDCVGDEVTTCQGICAAQGKNMERCRIAQLFRVTRIVDRNGAVKVNRQWVDGPMNCECEDSDDELPRCDQNCQKVIMIVAILGQIAWVCLTRTPPPIWVP